MSSTDIAQRPMFRFLILLTFVSAVASQGWTAMYTNFAVEVVGVTGEQTGFIHAMREVPGLLSVGVILLLLFMKEHTVLTLSVCLTGIGTIATGFFPSFHGVLITAVIMSLGFHYYEATVQSLTLQYFSLREAPLVMGRIRAATAAGSLFIGVVIFLMVTFFRVPYSALFILSGVLAVAGGLWGLSRHPEEPDLPFQRRRMIVRKRYWLFYLLTALSGARRHIFTTFSIFLLVSRFGFSVREMLALFIFNNVVNWFLNPLIGKAINQVGERKLLTVKYLVLALIFVAYCTVDNRIIVAGLYIVESFFSNFSMAIRSFFQKIGDARDIAPSMAFGQTVNHITAVILPIAGGILWMVDFRLPFAIGIAVALTALIMVQFIDRETRRAAMPAPSRAATGVDPDSPQENPKAATGPEA